MTPPTTAHPHETLRYDMLSTPIGPALAVVSDVGLRLLAVGDSDPEHLLERASVELRQVPLADPDALRDVQRQLDEYFDGERTRFEIDIDWAGVRGMRAAALRAITQIPYGETAGYGEVAITAGSPRAARAVGTACATTPISLVIPVHRVVRADGSLGEYGGRPEVKRFLLDLEAQNAPERARERT